MAGLPSIKRSNFTGKENLSYSYTNPYPSTDAVSAGYKLHGAVAADFAICADRNDGDADLAVTSSSAASLQRKLNSRNHNQDGQNVLFNDGHVDWTSTSFYGANRDCIYSIAKIVTTSGQTSQQDNPAGSSGWPTLMNANPKLDVDTVLLPAKGAGF